MHGFCKRCDHCQAVMKLREAANQHKFENHTAIAVILRPIGASTRVEGTIDRSSRGARNEIKTKYILAADARSKDMKLRR